MKVYYKMKNKLITSKEWLEAIDIYIRDNSKWVTETQSTVKSKSKFNKTQIVTTNTYYKMPSIGKVNRNIREAAEQEPSPYAFMQIKHILSDIGEQAYRDYKEPR